MSNAPPTPPPVNPIDIDDEARTTASSVLQTAGSTTEAPETSVAGESQKEASTATENDAPFSPSTAVYQRYLPKLLEHSANGQWKEFIEDAVEADLSLDGEQDAKRLQITIPLVLAYMIVDDLPVARSLLRQMHAFFTEAPIIQTLGSLLVAVSGRDYCQIYKRAEALIDYVTLPNFPLRELEKMIQNIVPFFVNHFRNQTLVLLTRAYSSLTMKLAVSYIGLPPDKVLSFLLKNRWTYDQTTETFTPPKIKGKGNMSIVPSTLDHFHALAGSVTRLEMYALSISSSVSLMVDIEFRPSTVQAQASGSDGNPVIVTEASVARSTTQLDASGTEERWLTLQFVWSGKQFSLDVADSDRVLDLKTAIQDLTRVPPDRQKILGLVKGKLPADQGRISDLNLTSGKKFTLLGTPEGDEIKDPSQLEKTPDVVNDFDFDPTQDPATVADYKNDQRNIRKVKEATDKLKLNIIHPLREGKRLLVLDLDYTILDTKPLTSGSLPPAECARPGLHEFLEAVYPHYDICVWSQTSWVWLETKLVELEMIGSNRNYHISFVLDKTSMFTVFSDRDGKPMQHHVKPLQIIWNHLPQFDASNTIHIDDLSRNFALNPQSGLKIQAFKNAHTPQSLADRELSRLSRYLVNIARIADFRWLSHKAWKDVEKGLPSS